MALFLYFWEKDHRWGNGNLKLSNLGLVCLHWKKKYKSSTLIFCCINQLALKPFRLQSFTNPVSLLELL